MKNCVNCGNEIRRDGDEWYHHLTSTGCDKPQASEDNERIKRLEAENKSLRHMPERVAERPCAECGQTKYHAPYCKINLERCNARSVTMQLILDSERVAEPAVCSHPIPISGPAQCKAGHWMGSPEHPVTVPATDPIYDLGKNPVACGEPEVGDEALYDEFTRQAQASRSAPVHPQEPERGNLQEAIKRHRDHYEKLAESGQLAPEDEAQLRHALAAPSAQAPQRFALSGRCDNGNHSKCPYPDKCKCDCHAPPSAQAGPEAIGKGGFAKIVRQAVEPIKGLVSDEVYRDVFIRVLAVYTSAKALNRTPPPVGVEEALAELRTRFPGEGIVITFRDYSGINGCEENGFVTVATGTGDGVGATLAEAMAAVRAAAVKGEENG